MHHLEGCHPLILSCQPRPLQSFDLMVLNLNAPIGKDGRQWAHFYPVPPNYAKLIVRPNYALVNKRTWRSFSLLRGLRARLLCGHAEHLTSRLCQPMGIVVIFSFRYFCTLFPGSQSYTPHLWRVLCVVTRMMKISDFASNVAVRRSVEVHTRIDEGHIGDRLQQLSQPWSSSRYGKQKTALEGEFGHFLASLTTPKSLSSGFPTDVVALLVWKDHSGKTKVHQ